MKKILQIAVLLSACWFGAPDADAQVNCSDGAVVSGNTYTGQLFFNYGSITNAFSNKNRTTLSVGEPLTGVFAGQQYNGMLGFFSRFLLPPLAPLVSASQGELLDRIQVTWTLDPLSPAPTGGYNIYRDDIFIASVGRNVLSYNDFNVIAGRPYIYKIVGINEFGEGPGGLATGFQVPNGVITGKVSTLNGTPVPDALVTLTPLQGFSAAFGYGDGAFFDLDTALTSLLPVAGNSWTIAFWIRTDSAANQGAVLRLGPNDLYFRAKNSSSGTNGIEISTTATGTALLSADFPSDAATAWRHIALTFNADDDQGRLYLDGKLMGITAMNELGVVNHIDLGASTDQGNWGGALDELRIYHSLLEEIDLAEVLMSTASSITPGLANYWKFDEEKGGSSFDIKTRQRIYFCGAEFSSDRPNVNTAGKTNAAGYYRVEGISYGTGVTFLATPSKYFYKYRALRFKKAQADYVTLPDFSLTPKSTLELLLNSSGPGGTQTVLSKKWASNEFRLNLVQSGVENQIVCYLNGSQFNFGNLGMGYQHLALVIDSSGSTRTISLYKNGVPTGTYTFTGITGNWSDAAEPWILGGRLNGGVLADAYGGFIDELAVYDSTLSQTAILAHVNDGRTVTEKGLRVYFTLDEGNGNNLSSTGSVLLDRGTVYGAEWSPLTFRQEVTPHEFSPVTRQVTLNPSVTSVDLVDFVDKSTISVSGYVRYQNTDCFVPRVEILVNGASYNPKIFTDSTGRFVVDLDPGTSVILSPDYNGHQFSPASWTVTNVTTPIAGILFNDVTTRKIQGTVAGGKCKKSIIQSPGTPQGTVCIVEASSADGCFARRIEIDNEEGEYNFELLPPLENMTVSVIEHSDPNIKSAFQTLGGSSVNLTENDTLVDFIYFAPPEVEIVSGLDQVSPDCEEIILDQGETRTLNVQLIENYYGGACALDTANFRFVNLFAAEVFDTTLSTSNTSRTLGYKFKVGAPNSTPPFKKSLQIIGTTASGRSANLVKEGIITGLYVKENTFTSMLPQTPSVILRDPPGDGSYAYLEQGTSVCKTYNIYRESSNGNGNGVEIQLGGEVEIATGIGVEITNTVGASFDISGEYNVTYQKMSDSSFQTCTTINRTISTSDGDLVVGGEQGGNVYLGEAINLIFGFADEVSFDEAGCAASVKTVINVEPDTFGTTFIYSGAYIKTQLIRYLDSLSANPDASPAQIADYQLSKTRWLKILERDSVLIANAKFTDNVSFDAGIVLEQSMTSDTATTTGFEEGVGRDTSIVTQIGFEFNGFGSTAMSTFVQSTSRGMRNENGKQTTVTTGYVLADDDPGDGFSVDIGMDSVYRTPVFRTKAGQSSCPWEPGTAHRDGTALSFRDGSGPVADNVPANEPAVFKFTLGNLSQTNETRSYAFTAGSGSNPHGAVIKLNGAPLDHAVGYQIPSGESIPITLTVERGPEEYNYDSLEVALYSECEDDRASQLGGSADELTYSAQFISVRFTRPCSEVEINVPQQDWVVFPDPLTSGPDDLVRITVSDYDTTNTDFSLIRLQYRRSDGNGVWINISPLHERYNPNWSGISTVSNPELLQPGFTQFFWNTTGLSDGPYEIRAVAVCTGNSADRPGYSKVIKGRIEREPPAPIGTPEPADGVLSDGDEISCSFNKLINCNLIQADQINPNNVGLYDVETNELIDAVISCYENRIIIVPNEDNRFIENKTLRVNLNNIEDKTGNKTGLISWEFKVDRNELAWLTDSIGMTKSVQETKTMTANIYNRSGTTVPFKIINSLPWVRVVPDTGVLVANEIKPIQFIVDSSLAIGSWSGVDTLKTIHVGNYINGGSEPLKIGARVMCDRPDWNLSAGQYENSMNLVLRVNIQGAFSIDPEDMVAAFIGDELRGRCNVEFVPQLNTYLAYLTVYGTVSDLQAPVKLQVWDAQSCLVYASVQETFNFVPDQVIGSPTAPQVVHTDNFILRNVPLGIGWNWISFNLQFPDNSINSALENLKYPENGLIKSQSSFSSYIPGTGWVGSLTSLNNTSMYNYRSETQDTLRMIGNLISPDTFPIPIVAGWNWIGYVPNYALPINAALESLPSAPGDLIKSQVAFAQYVGAPHGWIGNLKFMQPPNGYQLKATNPGSLIYPENTGFKSEAVSDRGGPLQADAYWTVNPAQYEYSSTFIGMLSTGGVNATTDNLELGAFYGGEARGSAQAVYIPSMEASLFFMTMYSNAAGQPIHFMVYDADTEEIRPLAETMTFSPDQHQGTVANPVPFTYQLTGTEHPDQAIRSFSAVPNPFRSETWLQFITMKPETVELTIYDARGNAVSRLSVEAESGFNVVPVTATDWSPGLYVAQLKTASGVVSCKLMVQ